MTLFAQHRAALFRLEGDVIVLAAIVANYFETRRRVFRLDALARTALRTSLRRHSVLTISLVLIFFTEQEKVFTLHTREFRIRHICTPPLNFLTS
jgi:hypothetical protein